MISMHGQVMEKLLQGEFICTVSDEVAFGFLQQAEAADKIEAQLNQMNRTLVSANDGQVFYCGYQTLGDNERKHLSEQFKDIGGALLPLVEWLVLVQEAQGDKALLTAGKVIRLQELQLVIEDTPAFSEQLQKIARYSLFNSTSISSDGQLKQIFKRLLDLGYLLKPNKDKQIFIATGKVDYLFDVIRFIDENEKLALAEQSKVETEQGELL
ncbi:hypothetical protein FE810_13415 [Thalassotalea litorea]|uniref:DUF4194 domain-containing protein n=1 Tax=Thalassotalea litorea TaxID=2020715 RepID=A0A5R9IGX9_9GAMM|nr:hypothetical protein [Thalassotalea litorea]TLU61814.1 hypothetical protein FE810_13415 [Thalassotalea litorea]